MNTKLTYSEKLLDVQWQKKRLQLLEAAGWRCHNCMNADETASGVTLHVHHSYYRKNVDPWNYPDACYQVLCKDCHEQAEEFKKELEEIIFTESPASQAHLLYVLRRVKRLMKISNFDMGVTASWTAFFAEKCLDDREAKISAAKASGLDGEGI